MFTAPWEGACVGLIVRMSAQGRYQCNAISVYAYGVAAPWMAKRGESNKASLLSTKRLTTSERKKMEYAM